jgi:hypothetical protein
MSTAATMVAIALVCHAIFWVCAGAILAALEKH